MVSNLIITPFYLQIKKVIFKFKKVTFKLKKVALKWKKVKFKFKKVTFKLKKVCIFPHNDMPAYPNWPYTLITDYHCRILLSTQLLSTLCFRIFIVEHLLSTLIVDCLLLILHCWHFIVYSSWSTLIVDSYCRLLLSILYIVDSLLHVDTYCWLFIV